MLLITTFILAVLCCLASARELPSSLKICSRNEKNLSQCVKESVEYLKPFLPSGDLGNDVKVIPFEPFLLDDIAIDRGADFKIKMKGVSIVGASNFKMEKLKIDIHNLTMDVLISFPKLKYSGKYEMDIKLNLFHLFGDGNFNGTLENGKARVKFIGSKVIKNGIEYAKIDKVGMKTKFENVSINLDNLFNGNKELSEVGNQVVNENRDVFLDEIIPVVEKSLSKKFRITSNGIFALAPFDVFFPE